MRKCKREREKLFLFHNYALSTEGSSFSIELKASTKQQTETYTHFLSLAFITTSWIMNLRWWFDEYYTKLTKFLIWMAHSFATRKKKIEYKFESKIDFWQKLIFPNTQVMYTHSMCEWKVSFSVGGLLFVIDISSLLFPLYHWVLHVFYFQMVWITTIRLIGILFIIA